MNAPNITKDMELRHLPTQYQLQLIRLLDIGDESVLSLLMGNIVKNLEDNNSDLRFDSADINLIREHSQRFNKSAVQIFFDEYSTMGKIRPKIKHLLELLIKCQLFHAADYVADLINEAHPVRPKKGPASRVDISLGNDQDIDIVVNNLNYPFSSINLTKINRINYMKPELNKSNTPNLEISENGNNNQPTATFGEVQQQQEVSDLIKFSTQIPLVVYNSQNNDTSNSNRVEIPMTVNSTDNISSNSVMNIPAISGLIASENESEIIPACLQSVEMGSSNNDSEVPDFSGLLNAQDSRSQFSSTIEQSQSMMSDSSINSNL